MARRRCKAKAKSTGKRCEKRGAHVCSSCGVCRHHGCNCKNPGGAPEGNANSLKHGIYSVGLTEEEKDTWDHIPIGSLEDEIRIAKLQLRRAVRAQAQVMDAKEVLEQLEKGGSTDDALLELQEFRKDGEKVTVTHRRPDYFRQIYQILGRIQRLEQARAQLEAAGQGPRDPDETAREIKGALDEMMELVEDVPANA